MSSTKLIMTPEFPSNSQLATRLLVEFVVDALWPTTLQLKNQLTALTLNTEKKNDIVCLKDVFSLCCSQIQKCVLHLLDIFQTEHRNKVCMKESRRCTLERLTWCLDKLHQVQKNLEKISQDTEKNDSGAATDLTDENLSQNSSILATPMYFVNWIDHTLEVLTHLSTIVYRTDYKDSTELLDTWMNEVIDSVSSLHTSTDELLMSAMTLCRYCLLSDQPVITARCQVVLRETKKLISEIIQGDVDKAYKVTKDSLKLPVKPTNINVFIDVLKDALYVLEANTNTALLSLLVHCLSAPLSTLKNLEKHFQGDTKDTICPCEDVDQVEDCAVIKKFDFYNERLMQIGGFSISCSSDENRIISLKSGLASLEALEPQLVPAVMLAATSLHTRFLTSAWKQELMQIRDDIFLIVDPAAFSQRAKQTMNKNILDLIKGKKYMNTEVCTTIDVAEIVLNLFTTYKTQEPEALEQKDKLEPFLADLQKALKECKTVSNLSSTEPDDFLYEIAQSAQPAKKVTFDQLMKRLKLLYTVVNRIDRLFNIEENGANTFNTEDRENIVPTDLTKTIKKEKPTTVNNFRNNLSKNIFAREASINQYSASKCIISKITKHLNNKKTQDELSFSVQLDELFSDISKYTETEKKEDIARSYAENQTVSNANSTSILYNFPLSKKDSLRKGVLRKKFANLVESSPIKMNAQKMVESQFEYELDVSKDVMNSTTQLQITEILDQLSNLSKMISVECPSACKKTIINISTESTLVCNIPKGGNILTLSVNDNQENVKNVWNIPVSHSDVEASERDFSVTSSTQSNVTTLERLSDIDLLENRLNQLKSSNI